MYPPPDGSGGGALLRILFRESAFSFFEKQLFFNNGNDKVDNHSEAEH